MKREASQKLDRWISQFHRKPLVIRGARQTGKTARFFKKQFDPLPSNWETNSC